MRKKSPERVKAEQELATLNVLIKKQMEETKYEKAHRIVQGAPKRPRKWATEEEPIATINDDGTVQLMEPEWYIDENGREVQLVTLETDWSLVDRYYPVEVRYKYFAPPKSKTISIQRLEANTKPFKMKMGHTKIAPRHLRPGEKERDARFDKFVRALEEKEEKIKRGKLIVARPSFLWKN